ncbi:hypothetical protein E5720_07475 [Rhodococcus sp. PAMC28707]|uniref:hypothetical protein n=1 Tax=unclassified Rhodococcus (in: high G+C Gram-positive bacteria) TaxID=192944 RepID=UPI00109DB3F8|nr:MULTISPECIES: hypothetical protein [unclassified Rhodococcus (in: high G+C Gram-positive bacteria)]QCB49934.1 hypothetical protein E5769_06540 [Rhodococcus sp. PAMC28705]QCB58373.1 hypothetical protein E5720_07475 [Rhodococcus sp. PAMC28707]
MMRAYLSLWRWVRGRTDVPQHGLALVAHQGTLAIPTAFGVATLVELVVLHLVLPWPWLRLLLAVVSIWSLVALLGSIAIHRVHPHYVTDTRLVLRQSGSTVLSLCRNDIASVVLVRRFSETTPTIRDGRLFLPNANGTSVDVTLRGQVDAQLPALIPKYRQAGSVGQISLCLDHSADFVALMKAEVPRR